MDCNVSWSRWDMSRTTNDEWDLASREKWRKDIPGKDSQRQKVEMNMAYVWDNERKDQADRRARLVCRRNKK